jgi:hypothetical protein
METIAILKALLKWEDKLLGNQINIVTDHRALKFFKTQRQLSSRQMRWMEYLSCFDFDIQYIKGTSNLVADSLSGYYQSDTGNDVHPLYDYITADSQLDPEGEDLPWNGVVELCAISENTRSRPLREAEEEWRVLAQEMANAQKPRGAPWEASESENDPTPFESLSTGLELRTHVERATDFLDQVKKGYEKDTLFAKIVMEKEQYASFKYRDGLLYTTNHGGHKVLCILQIVTQDYSLTAIVIEQAHTILGHFSAQKTAAYVCCWYWWPRLTSEIDKFCDTCGVCQANKTSMQRPVGLLHPLPIPNQPWGSIEMDFIGPFPTSKRYEYLWVNYLQVNLHGSPRSS